jgi:hypothetical protein
MILGIIVVVIFITIIVSRTQNAFQTSTPIPTRRPTYTYTRLPSYLPIKFTNKCDTIIYTAIYYKNVDDYWVTAGWWGLNPGETAYVADIFSPNFYTYGISEDGNFVWDGDDTYQTVRGSEITYGFDKKSIQDWDYALQNWEYYEIEFICE